MMRFASPILLPGFAALAACQQAGEPQAEPLSPDEQAALERAQAMIDENRDRLEGAEPDDETGNEQ